MTGKLILGMSPKEGMSRPVVSSCKLLLGMSPKEGMSRPVVSSCKLILGMSPKEGMSRPVVSSCKLILGMSPKEGIVDQWCPRLINFGPEAQVFNYCKAMRDQRCPH